MTTVKKHKRKINGKNVEVKKHTRKPFKIMPKSTFHLPVEQAVYVPSTNKEQKYIGVDKFNNRTKETQKFLSNSYGGFTNVRSIGGYTSDSGKLIKEDVNKVTAFSTEKSFKENQDKLKSFIQKKKKEWGQESIGIENEGDLYYI